MDLRGQSSSLEDDGLADRATGNFVVVKRRPLITVPSLLTDSIYFFQRLKGAGDVSQKEAHTTDAPLKGLRERLAEDPTVGEQARESAEHEDVRTLWVSLDGHGQRWKEWKQVCRGIQSHSTTAGMSSTRGPNCTLDLFRNWERHGSDPMIWLSCRKHCRERDVVAVNL